MQEENKQRLAKVLAGRGVASRRKAEQLIIDGKVEVNGEVVSHPGHPVDPSVDHIKVEGRPLPPAERKAYYVFNKPKGYVVTREDPEGRKTIWELLPDLPARVEPVGRLDINTEGVLLLTNDGPLAHALTHPSKGVPRRYHAKVWKAPNASDVRRLEAGINLEDGPTGPAKVRIVSSTDTGNTWLELTVTEGRNRLVRRMLAAIGHPVSKLRRVSFATISARDLEPGQYRMLSADEVARLRDIAGGVPATAAGHEGEKKSRSRVGFAKPDEKWLKRRLDGKLGRDKRKVSPRGGER